MGSGGRQAWRGSSRWWVPEAAEQLGRGKPITLEGRGAELVFVTRVGKGALATSLNHWSLVSICRSIELSFP